MPKITPFLWFDGQAKEATDFYDRAKADRAMQAMLKMNKIDIATLQKAADGKLD